MKNIQQYKYYFCMKIYYYVNFILESKFKLLNILKCIHKKNI